MLSDYWTDILLFIVEVVLEVEMKVVEEMPNRILKESYDFILMMPQVSKCKSINLLKDLPPLILSFFLSILS